MIDSCGNGIGYGISYGALTVINAIAMGKGVAFGIDLKTEAYVELTHEPEFCVTIDGHSTENTNLARYSVETLLSMYPYSEFHGAIIKTVSNIPISQGLKSSSAAANAILSATANALGISIDPLEIVRIGANASLKAGVSITGAFDDACACMLGGLVFTNNRTQELICRKHMPEDYIAVIQLPKYQIRKSAFPRKQMEDLQEMVSDAYNLAMNGDIFSAMYENGKCTCQALGISPDVANHALDCGATAAGLSGSGPATGILVRKEELDTFLDKFGRDSIIIANIRNGTN